MVVLLARLGPTDWGRDTAVIDFVIITVLHRASDGVVITCFWRMAWAAICYRSTHWLVWVIRQRNMYV